MIELMNKRLELSQSIYECLPVVKDLFVQYYGEEYRDRVNEKFDSVTYIGYGFPEHIESLLLSIFKEKSRELVSEFLKENNIDDSEENVKRFFGGYVNFNNCLNFNIDKIYRYLDKEEHTSYDDRNFLDNLKDISGNDSIVLGSEDCNKIIATVIRLRDSYNQKLDKFKQFKLQYNNYITYVEECNKLKNKINNKFIFKFLDEIRDYLSDRDKEFVDKSRELDYFYFSNLDCYETLVGFSYSHSCLLDSFSSESNQIINNVNSSEWKIDSIYSDRIKYFKKMGIDLGDDYQVYVNNPECLKIMPTVEFADKIISIRKRLTKEEEAEYITTTTNYIEQKNIIDKLGLLDKDTCYTYENLSNGITCVAPNIVNDNGQYKLHSLLLAPLSSGFENFDHFLIHEFNHLFELNLTSVSKDRFEVICGWDRCIGNINSDVVLNVDENTSDRRSYERFNEIINDMVAQEITTLMHDNGIFLFDDKDNARVSGASYQYTRFLVQDFLYTYKKDIIESRISGDMSKLYDKIGEDNFMKLNQLVSDFGDRFVGFRFYHMYQDLENNIDTEDVLYFKECVRVRDEILKSMEEVASKSMGINTK